MTDGMIQNTIKPFLDKYLQYELKVLKIQYYEANDIAMDLQKLQNTLIEKIKYEVELSVNKHSLLEKLIGDTRNKNGIIQQTANEIKSGHEMFVITSKQRSYNQDEIIKLFDTFEQALLGKINTSLDLAAMKNFHEVLYSSVPVVVDNIKQMLIGDYKKC